jgi:hypothetical protein
MPWPPRPLPAKRNWRVGEILLLGHEPFRLVGCFDAGGLAMPCRFPSQTVFIPYSRRCAGTGGSPVRLRVDALLFRAKAGAAPKPCAPGGGLADAARHGGDGVEWITPESLLQGIRRWQRAIAWTAGSGGALGLLLGAVTLAGMLLTGVRERVFRRSACAARWARAAARSPDCSSRKPWR